MKTARLSKGLSVVLLLTVFVQACNYRQTQPVMKAVALNDRQARGQQVYMAHCQSCHPQGEGGAGWPMLQVPVPGIAYKFRIRSRAFLLGLGKMPAFKHDKISREELNDLVAYVKKIRKNNTPAYPDSNQAVRTP